MKTLLRLALATLLCALFAGAIFYCDPLWVNDQQIRLNLWRSHVHSNYTDVDGYRMHFFEAAPPNGSPGIPLVLIHGLGSRGEDWAAMMPTLAAQGFHVYTPDLLGYGRSPKPDLPYTIAREEQSVVDFMHAVGLTHADVDGWSMGGWIAAKIALDQPQLVDRLVLDDAAGLKYQLAFDKSLFIPTDDASLHRLLALLTPTPPALPGFVVRATLRRSADNARSIQSSMDSMLSGDDLLDGRLGSITQPTLIVWGTEDKLIPIALGEQMHREIPHSVFAAIAGCGHLAPNECSKPVLSETIQFLKANPPMQGRAQTLSGTHEPGANLDTNRKAGRPDV